jgi:O-antigen/teichoic acid export membrane protein
LTLRRNIIANYAGQGWSGLMTLAFLPLYIRYLGIEAYALVGFFGVLQAWMILFDLGMTPTLTREMARFSSGSVEPSAIRDLLRTLELVALAVALAAIVTIWLLADYLSVHWLNAQKLPAETVRDAILLMSLLVGSRFCEAIYRSSLYGLQQQVWFNAVNAALSTLRYGGSALILAFVSPTINAFFIWHLLVSLLMLVLLGAKLYRTLPPGLRPARFSRTALKSIQAFALGMIGINLLSTLLMQVDKILLSRMLPLDHFGHYMLATTICALIMMVVVPVTQALGPVLVRHITAQDGMQLRRDYHLGAQLIVVLVAPVAMIFVLFPVDFVSVWSGDAVLAKAVAPSLALLALGTLLSAVVQMPNGALLAHGWTRIPLVVNLVAVVFLIPTILLVVPRFGTTGAAGVWLLLNLGYVLIEIPLIHRRMLPGELWPLYRDAMLAPIAAVTLTGLLMLALRSQFDFGRVELGAYLIFAALVGTLAAALAAGAVRTVALDTIRRYLVIRKAA